MLEPGNNDDLPPSPGKRYLTIGEVMDHLVESGPQPRQAIADASDLANLMYRIAESK